MQRLNLATASVLASRLLAQFKALGFAGVQNFPTVGLIDGKFRQNLEARDMCRHACLA